MLTIKAWNLLLKHAKDLKVSPRLLQKALRKTAIELHARNRGLPFMRNS
jgi:hypothetical protein